MHFATLPLPVVLVNLLLCFNVEANSGYAGSCNGYQLTNMGSSGWYLTSNCRMNNGEYTGNYGSGIYLNDCIGNAGGVMQAQSYGGFSSTCSGASLSGTVLTATCGNGHGGYNKNSIDTNNFIGNANGQLFCFNHT